MQKFDLIIVGAGMVGATIACGLANSGLRIGLLDRALPKPYEADEVPRMRVSAINLASEQILRNIGAWGHIEATRTCPYRALAVSEMPARFGLSKHLPDISSWARTCFEADSIGNSHLGHIIENDLIQLGLLERVKACKNITLICPVDIESINILADEVTVASAAGEHYCASLIIGADGAQSQVRRLTNIGVYSDRYEQQALVATVQYRGEQIDTTWQAFRPEGPLAFLPLASSGANQYASLVWYDTAERLEELKAMDEASFIRTLSQTYPADLPRIELVHSRASFPLVKSHALRYASERAVLAGDAAHTINPLAGQGVNLGLMDAAVLIETIGKAQISERDYWSLDVLKGYESQRRKHNQLMMNAMDLFYHGFGSRLLPLHVMRNIGLGLAQRSGPAKRKVTEFATGLGGQLPRLAQLA